MHACHCVVYTHMETVLYSPAPRVLYGLEYYEEGSETGVRSDWLDSTCVQHSRRVGCEMCRTVASTSTSIPLSSGDSHRLTYVRPYLGTGIKQQNRVFIEYRQNVRDRTGQTGRTNNKSWWLFAYDPKSWTLLLRYTHPKHINEGDLIHPL